LELFEAFALNRVANGVWMDAQFSGNGADFPVLGNFEVGNIWLPKQVSNSSPFG
jgi:hypothetical protein